METRYYYRRVPEDKRASWKPCTKARAEKRQAARGQIEAFFNFIISLTETYPDIPDKGFVIIREFETEDYEGSTVTVTVSKALTFGGEEKEYRAGIALDIYESAADTALAWAMRQ